MDIFIDKAAALDTVIADLEIDVELYIRGMRAMATWLYLLGVKVNSAPLQTVTKNFLRACRSSPC